MPTYSITESTAWKQWVTPRRSRNKAVHRWHLFPHSFTDDLVHALVDEWKLDERDRILEPFAGAGTTLLAAKERGVPGFGYDLSPLAVLISNTKTASVSKSVLEIHWRALQRLLERMGSVGRNRRYSALVRMALPHGRLEALDSVAAAIDKLDCTSAERDFFRLALIAILPRFSRAVANGGWLRWSTEGIEAGAVEEVFGARVEMMLSDLPDEVVEDGRVWKTGRADARQLPDPDGTYTAVITSPPYPNRHDYTRVFGVELMFEFLDWEGNRALRHQSFHSHPEARPKRPAAEEYVAPEGLERSVEHLEDARIQRMLRGYFLDMHLCLREIVRVCRGGAKIAFVVGNARYGGKALLVDEFTAELGERAGLACEEIRAVRWRGNSAQQMGKYGRVASRESVVIFQKEMTCRSDKEALLLLFHLRDLPTHQARRLDGLGAGGRPRAGTPAWRVHRSRGARRAA